MKTADLDNKLDKKAHRHSEFRSVGYQHATEGVALQSTVSGEQQAATQLSSASIAAPAFRLHSSEENMPIHSSSSVNAPFQLRSEEKANKEPFSQPLERYQLSSQPSLPVQRQSSTPSNGVVQRSWLPEWVNDGLDAAGEMAESGMNTARSAARTVGRAVSSGAEAVTETVSNVAESVSDGVSNGVEAVGNVVRSGARHVANGARAVGSAVSRGAGQVAESVGDTVRSGAETVARGARAVGNTVRRGAERAYEGAREVVGSVRDGVSSGVERVGRTVRRGAEAVTEGVANLANRARAGASSLVQRGSEVVQAGLERIRNVGSSVQEAVSVGITAVREFGARALEKARDIGENTRAAVSDIVNRLANRSREIFNHVFSTATASDVLLNSVLGTARALDSIFGPNGTAIQAEDIPDEHAFDEFVARHLAYIGDGNINMDDQISAEQVDRLRSEGFEDDIQTIEGEEGFQMTFIVPQPGSGRNPMLAIRGSEDGTDMYKDWGSDMDYHQVGDRQFNANRERIAQVIEYLCQNSETGQIDLTGHSLGGGLAQTIMAHHTRQIARLTTFAAPGQNQESVDMYNQNVEEMRAEGLEGPEVAHHVEDQGMVYLVGEGHLPGTTYRHDVGHIDFVEAHTTNLIDGVEDHSIERFDEFPDYLRGQLAEVIRRGAGSTVIGPLLGELDQLQDMRNEHYNRNDMNQVPETEPVDDPNWRRLPDSQSIYHQNGEEGRNNRKYVSADGGNHEAVYNEQGELVRDNENMGTYNFHGPDDTMGHLERDVVPYWIWGNNEEDQTPLINRIFGPRIRERILEGGQSTIDSLRESLSDMVQEGMRKVRGEEGQE
ncbi:MAG: hypothetical protein AAF587_03660 [Bacteroidota bacterium]